MERVDFLVCYSLYENFNKVMFVRFIVISLVSLMISSCLIADEYGICLLPSADDTRKIEKHSSNLRRTFVRNGIPYNNVKNVMHVSIFQGVFDERSLTELKSRLFLIFENFKSAPVRIDPKLEDTKENIFLNLHESKEIQEVFQAFFKNKLHELRDKTRLMKQVKRDIDSGLSPDKYEKIIEFGLYWNLPGHHNPHFTLVYGSNKNEKIASILSQQKLDLETIIYDRIAIGRLGFEGNVEEIVYSLPLKKRK